MQFLREKFVKVDKIFYFSDGSAAQYKNRENFLNLCYHESDFRVLAERHFYATSHGKGPCDRIGGTVKRLAARASLQTPYCSQFMTPRQLFEWTVENFKSLHFKYCTTNEYYAEDVHLEKKLKMSRTIPGTQKLQCFIPVINSLVLAKTFSNSKIGKEERVTLMSEMKFPLMELQDFSQPLYENQECCSYFWICVQMQKLYGTTQAQRRKCSQVSICLCENNR